MSNIVSEVASGLQGNVVVESNQNNSEQLFSQDTHRKEEALKKLCEHIKRMLDAIGNDAFNGVDLFEGSTPAPAQQQVAAGSVDLGSPSDSGVDISSLMGGASKIWKAMK